MKCNISQHQYKRYMLTRKYKPIVRALKNYNFNSREKFEHGPGDLDRKLNQDSSSGRG